MTSKKIMDNQRDKTTEILGCCGFILVRKKQERRTHHPFANFYILDRVVGAKLSLLLLEGFEVKAHNSRPSS